MRLPQCGASVTTCFVAHAKAFPISARFIRTHRPRILLHSELSSKKMLHSRLPIAGCTCTSKSHLNASPKYLKPCSSWSPKSGSPPQHHRLPGRSRQPSGFLWFNPFLQSTVGEFSGQLHLAFFTLMHKARSIRTMTIGRRFHKPFTLVLADRQQQSTMIPWTSRLLLRASMHRDRTAICIFRCQWCVETRT